mmetsp:Transcript_84628/g.123859  ORF Transcript_84628/g.123859 Transcript_84628/m.123859 type:complete len:154 (-) Transcript_84628:341-802(-)
MRLVEPSLPPALPHHTQHIHVSFHLCLALTRCSCQRPSTDPAVSAGAGSMSSAGTSENRNASKKNVKRIADKMRQDTRHPDNPPDEFDKCSEEYLTSVPFWERFTHYLSNEYLINAPGKDNHGFDSMDGADWRQWQNWRRLFESYAAQRSWWF